VPFIVAIALWGGLFWMGIPELFQLLADRSTNRADQVGNAQATMSAGRLLGLVSGALMMTAGAVVEGVATHHRWTRPSPDQSSA
jgi:hypothetical protein